MKKVCSIILIAVVMLTVLSFKVSAAKSNTETMMPLYNNTLCFDCNFAINRNSREAIIMLSYEAMTGISVDALIVSYIESYSETTGRWRRIDIGTTNDQWVDESSSTIFRNTHTTTIHYPGRYRAVVEFTISGTGGAPDVYTYISEDTFP